MNPISWLLLAPLAPALAWCLWTLWRERDLRLALVAGFLATLIGRQLVNSPSAGDELTQLAMSEHLGPLLLDFSANLLAALTALAVARSVVERNRAEQLHWEGMEAVHALATFVNAPERDFDNKIAELLALGCWHLRSEVGMLLRIEGERCEVLALNGPASLPLEQGEELALDDAFGREIVDRDQLLAIENTAVSQWKHHSAVTKLGFARFLGVPVRVAGQVWGALCFASVDRPFTRVSGGDKQLLELMTHWVGGAVARREAWQGLADLAQPEQAESAPSKEARRRPQEPRVARAAPRRPSTGRRDVQIDALVAEREARLREAVGPDVKLVLDLAAPDCKVRMLRSELERILWSLLLQAADLTEGRGELIVETRLLSSGDPGATSNAFATLGVRATNTALDDDALSDLLDRDDVAPARHAGEKQAHAPARLSLPRIRRSLLAIGGDISAHSGESEGTTLTSYLPALPQEPKRKARPRHGHAKTPFATG